MAQLLPIYRFTSAQSQATCSIECRARPPPASVCFPVAPQKKFRHESRKCRKFGARAFDLEDESKLTDDGYVKIGEEGGIESGEGGESSNSSYDDGRYPGGEFVYKDYGFWGSLGVKCKMLVALPWERVKKGSVLVMKLRGEVNYALYMYIRILYIYIC